MQFFYVVALNGESLRHECSYHTREVLDDRTCRLIFPRFHQANELMELDLVADLDQDSGVYRCTLAIRNSGTEPVRLSQADIGLSFTGTKTRLDFFQSDWGSEFSPRSQIVEGEFSFGSVAGRSCKGFIPYAECHIDDTVYAMALAWSGNWTCTAFPLAEAIRGSQQRTDACVMGLSDDAFYHDIPGGGHFVTPAVYMVQGKDREAVSLALRRYYQSRLSRLDERQFSPLPLEYNTWWPYEDKFISEEVYQKNAGIAKSLGFRYAMLDAGWFGESKDGQTWVEKRGDWDVVNPQRFPSGLKALCDKAKLIGIKPGIWCEIEAVGPEAMLNQTHEAIIAKRDGRSLGYVCFGSREGREWARKTTDRILGDYGARWIKLDFNLDPAFGCSRTDHDHGPGDGLYAHYMGYYQFLDDLGARYPDVVIENCSSGGLRNDIEMLSHCHFAFLSDPDHTELHLQLFWGALSYLHQSSLLHFMWSEILGDHNDGIRQPITADMPRSKLDYMVRAVMMGVPGFSHRLPELPAWVLERIRELGDFYTRYSTDFILHGDAWRLTDQPLASGRGERFPVFQFNAPDQRAMVFAFRLPGGADAQTVMPRELDPDRTYQVTYLDAELSLEKTGSELMQTGLTFNGLPTEGSEIITLF